MNNQRPEFLPSLLSAIAIVGIIFLTAINHAVPDVLNIIAVASLAAAGAISQPRSPGGPAV